MSETYYKQCTFRRPIDGGHEMETSWIPESLAVLGKKIYFGKKSQVSPQLWEVYSVSDDRLPESYLKNHERDYKTQREASDI